jgi:hypothetical protein
MSCNEKKVGDGFPSRPSAPARSATTAGPRHLDDNPGKEQWLVLLGARGQPCYEREGTIPTSGRFLY